MAAFAKEIIELFGLLPEPHDLTVVFSVRLDECGTDGYHDHVVVAGGVAATDQWSELELAWDGLMRRRSVPIFHAQEFHDGDGPYDNWGQLKRKNFVRAQEKIIRNAIPFTVAAAVHKETHTEVKDMMRGVKKFTCDSDYGLCFRAIRFLACQKIAEHHPKTRVKFIVESGPYASSASSIYEQVLATKGAAYRPAMYSEMLDGFAHLPKGRLRSLEAADYLADRSISDLRNGTFLKPGRKNQMSLLMDAEFLHQWYEDMLKAREKRRSYSQRKLLSSASRGEDA